MKKTIIETFIENGYSPAAQLNAVYERLEEALGGNIDIVDTTSPFACSLDMGACLAASSISSHEALLRKQYKALATGYEDLYLHMSDEEYLGRFSNFSSASMFMYILKDEVVTKAVAQPDSEVRKLVIPKHTEIQVDGTVFTLLYPIELRIMPHGGLQIVYDTSSESPIKPLTTNYINWKVVSIDNKDFVMLYFDAPQVLRKVYKDTLNPSSTFIKEYKLIDKFYYCRVFGVDNNGVEVEYSTSHSDIVHDINVPTAVLTVLGDKVRIEIPQIYFSANMLPGEVKIEIYTTKGDISLDFSNYELNAFGLQYGSDFAVATDSVYSAPLKSLSAMAVGSSDTTTGGTNGIEFKQLRENVVDNSTKIQLPITETQLRSKLRLNGYDLILSIDNIMRRIYLATRNLPAVAGSGFDTGAAATVGSLQTSMTELAKLTTVIDNGARLTILPETIYQFNEDGVLVIVPTAMLPSADNPDFLASEVNRNEYMFSPNHYVVDTNGQNLKCRPYQLDAPSLVSRRFVAENDTSQLAVSTDSYLIEKKGNGYVLTVTTLSGPTYLEQDVNKVFAQLSFVPKNELGRVYLNGSIIGISAAGNYVWEFPLNTLLDIDEQDYLMLTDFTMFAGQFRDFGTMLTQEFEIVYGIHDYSIFGLKYTDIDNKLGTHLLDSSPLGLTNEALTINFGTALANLWSATRTVAGSVVYQTHDVDVPNTWPENQYELNEDGTVKVSLVDGEIVSNKLHDKGDPILKDGEPTYIHKAGEVVYDEEGNPIILYGRGVERILDIVLIDGIYAFASHPRDIEYRNTIAGSIVQYAGSDMDEFKPILHEKTELYFYPKKTLGEIKVVVEDGKQVEIPAALSFTVRYYMESSKYKDTVLREAIISKTSKVINTSLQQATVSRDDIQKALKEAMGDDIVAVDMDNLGENKDIPVYTSLDDSTRCAVKRRLRVLPDSTTIAEEAITIDWLAHKA